MTGLEKITDRILAEARVKGDKILADADAECQRLEAEYGAAAQEIRERIFADAEKEGKDLIARARSTAATEHRNRVLALQSELIDDAFDGAMTEIRAWDPGKYTDLLVGLLTAAFTEQMETEETGKELYGEEEAQLPTSYEVLLNQADREKCGAAVIDGTRRKLLGKVPEEKLAALSLSETVAPISGGLILRYGDVESNCSLELLFAGLREELEAEVSHALFAPKKQD